MLHEEYERHSTSSLEEKKSNPPEKDFVAFDFQAKTLNMSEFQTLLQTADNLLQKNQIKEAIKLYEHSLNQAEGLLNQDDFKNFFQKTIKDLNIYYLKLMNKKPQNQNEDGFKHLSSQYQTSLQSALQKADETLKSGNIKEALGIYDIAISQALAFYSKQDFEDFFQTLIKELNIYAIKLLNAENEDFCFQILSQCDQWTQPGTFGNHPDLRIFIYNHFGCYYRRLENLELALSFLMKALKLLNVSQNEHYLGLTHMNIAAVLSHLGDHVNAKNHSVLSVKHILQAMRKKKMEKCEKNDLVDLVIILGISYHNLGNEEEFFRNLDKSHEFFQKSISEIENIVAGNHPLLMKFKAELTIFQEKYIGQLKNTPKTQQKPKKLLYEKEIQAQGFFKNRPKSANPNKKPFGFNQSQNTYLQANSLKQTDFYFLGNKILRKPKIEQAKLKTNNFLENTKKSEIPPSEKKQKKEDFALENSNISSRSGNEINYLEKKGVLDWDSEGSAGSENDKIKKNRVNFLEDLTKTQKNIEKPISPPPPSIIQDVPPIQETKKPEIPVKKEQITKEISQNALKNDPNNNQNPKLEAQNLTNKQNSNKIPDIVVMEKEALIKLNEEKQQKSNELTEMSKKGKTLEKNLEDLSKKISNKAQEIKSLESEENRKNKVLYDQDKEILKKVQELQALEAKLAELQNTPITTSIDKTDSLLFSSNQIQKIVRIQQIMRKVLHFFNVQRQKNFKVMAKPAWTLFPSLEKNQYTKSLLKVQRKCKFMIYLSKPSRKLIYAIFCSKPIILFFEHSFDLSEIFKKFKPNSPILSILQEMLPELNNCLIILENKRLCLEEFLINKQKNQGIEIVSDKYEVFFMDPIHSKIKYAKELKKGADSMELENQININRRKLEEMKKLEELSKLEDERKKLEVEVLQKKEEKMRDLKKLEEQKNQEEKEANFAKKELERRKQEQEKALKLQKFVRRRLGYRRFELNTRVTILHKRKACFYKKKLVWIKVFSRTHKQEKENFVVFYFFNEENHIIFKKKMKISLNFMKQLNADFANAIIYFSISLLKEDIMLRNMALLANSINKLSAFSSQGKRKIQLEDYRFGFDAISAEAMKNVFKKKKKEEPVSKELPPKKQSQIALKKEMTIVNEEIEDEGIISPKITKKKTYDLIDIVKEYLVPFENKASEKYRFICKTLFSLGKMIEKKKRIKIFEKMRKFIPKQASSALIKEIKSAEIKTKTEIKKRASEIKEKTSIAAENIVNKENKTKEDEQNLIGKLKVLDNMKNSHNLEVRFEKNSNCLIIKGENPELKQKIVEIPKETSPMDFFKKYQANIVIFQEKSHPPEILFYSPEEMDKICKIKTYSDSKKYQQVIPVKMMKSGKDYELKLPKISPSEPIFTFQLFNKTSGVSNNYELEIAHFPKLQGKELDQAVVDYILAHLQHDKSQKELIFSKTVEEKRNLKKKVSLKLFLVNFEKEFEFSFDFDVEQKTILASCHENRDFSLEFPVKNEASAQNLCEKLLLEIGVFFIQGKTRFITMKGSFSEDCYEVINEKNFNLGNDCLSIVSRIIAKDQNLYLMNMNQKKGGVFLQEISLITKKEEALEISERFKDLNCKKLLYDMEFYGVDEGELLPGEINANLEKIKTNNNKQVEEKDQEKNGNGSLISKPADDEEMNNAALTIQSHYKKKKEANKPERENDKDFLKTIKEENETKNSNMDDSSMNKSNNQMKFIQKEEINMPFDEEMDQAAAKIQKHYRNKKKGGPEAENKKNEIITEKEKEKEKEEEEKIDMELTEEMDLAALKIQKHYKNKKKTPENKKEKEVKGNMNEKPNSQIKEPTKKEEIIALEITQKKPPMQNPDDDVSNMVFDDDMDKAALKIQGKYRKRQENRKNKEKSDKKQPNANMDNKEKSLKTPIENIPDKKQEEIVDMKFDEEMDQAAKKIQEKYRKKQENRKKQQKPQEEPTKKPEPKIVVNQFDEEMDEAARKIQKKYRKKPKKPKQNLNSIPNDFKESKPKEDKEEKIEMEFDQEMDDAAKKIQVSYRKKQKNREKKKEKAIKEKPKVQENALEMEFDKEQDDAAKFIQKKYRKKQENKKNKDELQTKKEGIQPKKDETPQIEMEFDKEQDDAAKFIQQKYRKKQNNKKKEAKKEEKTNEIQQKKETPTIEMEFDKEQDDAAKFIQQKYRKKQNKKKEKEEIPAKKAEIQDKKEEKTIEMEFDKEQDDAAKLIQEKYRKKQKNRQNATKSEEEEKPHYEEQERAEKNEKKTSQGQIHESSKIITIEPELQGFNMIIEEGMEDAAKLIQKKYRTKQKNKQMEEPKVEKPTKKQHESLKGSPGNRVAEEIDEDINMSGEFGEHVSLGDVSQKDIEL